MEISVILPHVEALIFASEKPLTSLELTELINNALGFLDDKITLDQIESAVQGVIEKYDSDFYPFEIRESGGGWQFLTKKDYHKTVAQLNGDKFLKRLSSASLESLAIIAYKQPITKGEVESIRGVNSDYSIQKLLDKELIVITGRNEDLPGKPLVYATSKHFMDYFGINSADELPMIKEILSSQPFLPSPVPQPNAEGLFKDGQGDDEPLIINEEDNDPLVVRANGELIEEPRVVVDEITEVVEPDQVIENDSNAEEETDNEFSEDQDSFTDTDEVENDFEESSDDEVPANDIEASSEGVSDEDSEQEAGEDDDFADNPEVEVPESGEEDESSGNISQEDSENNSSDTGEHGEISENKSTEEDTETDSTGNFEDNSQDRDTEIEESENPSEEEPQSPENSEDSEQKESDKED